jgi:hypothetical protein
MSYVSCQTDVLRFSKKFNLLAQIVFEMAAIKSQEIKNANPILNSDFATVQQTLFLNVPTSTEYYMSLSESNLSKISDV